MVETLFLVVHCLVAVGVLAIAFHLRSLVEEMITARTQVNARRMEQDRQEVYKQRGISNG